MTYTNTAAVSNVPMNTKDLESQHAITPQQTQQKNRGWNLKKGAIALVCAATAGVTLREFATQHFNSSLHGHAGRTLITDTGNSTLNNSTTANTTCPEGSFRFDKASQLKRARIAAIVSMGVLPGLAIAGFIAMSSPFSDPDNETVTGLAMCTMITSVSVAIFTIPVAALMLIRAKSAENDACAEYINPVYSGRY